MNDKPAEPALPNGAAFARPRVVRDILVVASPIVTLGAAGYAAGIGTLAGGAIVNLGYVLAIVVGALILERQGSGWREIGLARPASWLKTGFLGVGACSGAVVAFAGTQVVILGVLSVLGFAPSEVDQSRFHAMAGNLPLLVLMVILAWTTIAFGEELFYRAFLITRMIDHGAIGRQWAIVISGSIFGAAHVAEGPVGIISNAAMGMLFGWIYLRSARNLWITIVGHGLINTLRFALLYAGAA